jgi:hypothetical protein
LPAAWLRENSLIITQVGKKVSPEAYMDKKIEELPMIVLSAGRSPAFTIFSSIERFRSFCSQTGHTFCPTMMPLRTLALMF